MSKAILTGTVLLFIVDFILASRAEKARRSSSIFVGSSPSNCTLKVSDAIITTLGYGSLTYAATSPDGAACTLAYTTARIHNVFNCHNQ